MRKKQYFPLWLFSFLVLGGASFLPAQAQQKEVVKTGPGKQAKVKIFKQEGEALYLLDTTLTIVEGKAMIDAVKEIQADSVSFKILGAKKVKPVKISSGKDWSNIRYFPAKPNDSLSASVFRISGPDSVHTRMKAVRIFGATTLLGDSVRGAKSKGITIYRSPKVMYHAITQDSLGNRQQFFRLDTTVHLKADKFLLRETVRVENSNDSDEVKVTRRKKNSSDAILETGNYEVIRLKQGDHFRIIILQAAKGSPETAGKQEFRGKKKKDALKAAHVGLQFYPNPTSGRVTISFSSPKKAKAQVRVVDSQGKTVYHEDLGSVEGQLSRELNLARFGKGMYVILVQIGKTAQSGKVVVE
ncbi:T9SS type A sorting domain-containing protein [Rufibacter tibetensis]|uniref:Secretion system C-terminal sorting domain-containing protein n=1 Tax=Rufibacter tibetensis TaxID=512763 RepID=A0A0P0C592_9BACT|nr:T9SS type A sorting domain-containing protein [Rufibacter tibetensis]ALJ00367.1 hypothetical protein DC20_17060 [Rufibacter tibetensis]